MYVVSKLKWDKNMKNQDLDQLIADCQSVVKLYLSDARKYKRLLNSKIIDSYIRKTQISQPFPTEKECDAYERLLAFEEKWAEDNIAEKLTINDIAAIIKIDQDLGIQLYIS